MKDNIVICLRDGGDRDGATLLADKLGVPISDSEGDELTVVFDNTGLSLRGYGLSYQGDFEAMIRRVSDGRLSHEMLAKAVKSKETSLRAIDATAGMGEDAFIIAAYGYEVTLCEQNPVIAALLKDAIRRAKKNPAAKDIVGRMHVYEGDSIELLSKCELPPDVIYLDPMFPARQKSGLINKKLQLIQKLEPPCAGEEELFCAAIAAGPKKIVVKRPLKSPNLAGKRPNYVLSGKAIRYDCYAF